MWQQQRQVRRQMATTAATITPAATTTPDAPCRSISRLRSSMSNWSLKCDRRSMATTGATFGDAGPFSTNSSRNDATICTTTNTHVTTSHAQTGSEGHTTPFTRAAHPHKLLNVLAELALVETLHPRQLVRRVFCQLRQLHPLVANHSAEVHLVLVQIATRKVRVQHLYGQFHTQAHNAIEAYGGRFVQLSTAKHSTAQHSTAQHSTAQHSTAQHSTAQHSTAQHSTAQHSTAQYSTAPGTGP